AVKDFMKARGLRHAAERAISIVAIEPGAFTGVFPAKIIRGDVRDARGITGSKEVKIAIVVVIKEPGGKGLRRFTEAGVFGFVPEMPDEVRAILNARWANIMQQHVRQPIAAGEKQVRTAVIIIIAARATFHETELGNP